MNKFNLYLAIAMIFYPAFSLGAEPFRNCAQFLHSIDETAPFTSNAQPLNGIDPRYNHLQFRILPQEFRYVLFSDRDSYWRAVHDLATLRPTDPTFLFSSDADHSMVLPDSVPITGDREEIGWVAVRIVGDMPFGSVQGLISTISQTLKENGLGTCVISTNNSDFFLIRRSKLEQAIEALENAGWGFSQ